jgi:spore maturation protein CgeB
MLKIDCILDRFSFDCFAPEVSLRPLAIGSKPSKDADLLFVESAWDSVNGGWYLGTDKHREELEMLLRECRKKGIPTVFWGKEDPVQVERFKWITPQFDYVCTTASETIKRHTEILGHDRIAVLPFAAQPDIHYSDPSTSRENVPCFAGAYYDDQFAERQREVEYVIKPATAFGLHLYDRGLAGNFYKNHQTFPKEYTEYLKPAVPYEKMGQIYRSYDVFLNIGCVTKSPTMFSRRVFEVLASGTPLISAYSVGIEHLLGDVVHLSKSASDTKGFLKTLLKDKAAWQKSSISSQTAVLKNHTYAHRLRTILEHCQVSVPERTRQRITRFEKAALATTQEGINEILGRQADAKLPLSAILS